MGRLVLTANDTQRKEPALNPPPANQAPSGLLRAVWRCRLNLGDVAPPNTFATHGARAWIAYARAERAREAIQLSISMLDQATDLVVSLTGLGNSLLAMSL